MIHLRKYFFFYFLVMITLPEDISRGNSNSGLLRVQYQYNLFTLLSKVEGRSEQQIQQLEDLQLVVDDEQMAAGQLERWPSSLKQLDSLDPVNTKTGLMRRSEASRRRRTHRGQLQQRPANLRAWPNIGTLIQHVTEELDWVWKISGRRENIVGRLHKEHSYD